MAKTNAKEWLARWASDNMHERYTNNSASLEQATADCLNAAEVEGISASSVIAAADCDLAAYLQNFKT